jgi:putative ABC transport system permease protein
MTDRRHGARSVARQRGYSALVILALGLSLGAAAAALAVVRVYVWTPLPYPHADRLVTVDFNAPGEPAPRGIFGIDWQGVDAVADLVVAWDIDGFTLVDDQQPTSADGRWIRPDVFPMFGITPVLGRVLTQDDIDQQAPVAMIGRGLWLSRFGGTPDVLGRAMTVRSADRPDEVEVFTIVGVLPDRFWHLEHRTQVLLPLRGPRSPSLLRLREGVSVEDAATQLTR